ncbi:MAG: sialidase family protein, partial [Actinomycetaceae bacterium]|nr:sialidase family protein [Actinomycetaceae bacterium]
MKRPTLRALAGVAAASALMWAAPIPAFADDPKDPLTVTIERTDNLGDTVREGDRLTYTISYTNNTDTPITAYPRTSNMSDVAVGAAKNCRWAKLAPKATKKCTFGYHVTGVDDVTSGFTPTVTFDATRDREGEDVIKTGITAQAPTVKIEPVELADGVKRNLATAGLAGFACHRIPALTTANNGWIIAAWDGRPDGCADAPQANSIIGRISKDGGKTWSAPMTIAAGKKGADKYGYSDPSFVTDRETGEIFAFFVKSFDRGIAASGLGTDPNNRNVIHAAVTSSKDNGLTWSTPRVITEDITGDPEKEYGRFATSGEGIQLRYGDHAGRLVQQFAVNYVQNGLEMRAVSVYSDDHGKTWKAGTPFGVIINGREPYRMDENKVVELSDGTLMVNSRTQGSGSPAARWVAYSRDGGQTYSEVKADHTLVDPRNNASIIRAYPNAPEGSRCAKILLFSNAATTNSRTKGTIRVSYNDGKTWTSGKVFESGSMQYSTMTALPEPGHYGLLYESAGPTITYMPFSMEWLGEDPQCDLVDAGTQTDPTETKDEGTQTDPSDTTDQGTQTDQSDTNDEGTQTDPSDT